MINLNVAFLFQVVNFLVLLFILNLLLYRPLRKILAERRGEIEGARARAAAVDQDVQGQMAEYEARLRELRAKAADERSILKKAAQAEEAAILEKARGEASATLEAVKAKVASEASAAKAQLQAQAQGLSMEICEKVLGRSL